MKKIFFILFLSIFSLNIMSQTTTTTKRVKATESMCRKIEIMCTPKTLAKTLFYESNKELLSYRDIQAGKGIEILRNLYKYPQYSENFLREVYRIWGYRGFKELGFTDEEIIITKKIINNPLK
ncbi:MAG: hypothetical protein J1E02_02065 [Coprobacter sp.]|nr:hypothetical protein [Coprobacter sp.]